MVTIRGDHPNNKRSMGAAIPSPLKQQHNPPSRLGSDSRLPLPIPPGTAASKYEHVFMDHCEFRPSPVHGYGVFAIQDIEAGTEIIKENALWVVDTATAIKSTFSEGSDYSAPRYIMIDSFYRSNLAEEDEEERLRLQQDILTLCGGFNSEEMASGDGQADMQTMSERLREILIVNGVAESSDGQADYAAIFRASSRLNHSCAPNAERMRSKLNDGSVVSFQIHNQARLDVLILCFSGQQSKPSLPSRKAKRSSSTILILSLDPAFAKRCSNLAGTSPAPASYAHDPRKKSTPQTTDVRASKKL